AQPPERPEPQDVQPVPFGARQGRCAPEVVRRFDRAAVESLTSTERVTQLDRTGKTCSLSLRERAEVRGHSKRPWLLAAPPHPNPLPEGEGTVSSLSPG